MSIPRRNFLVGGLATAAIGAGTWAWLRAQGYAVRPSTSGAPGPARAEVLGLPGPPYPPRALAALPLLVDVLLPGDSSISLPSGSEAGVVDFLVSASRAPGLTPLRNDILKLTRYLDIEAERLRGVRFEALERAEDRAAVVKAAAEDRSPRGRFEPARALEAALRLSLEGYLGHPHHGGNKGAAVWDALDIPMPRDRSPLHHHHG